MDFNTLYEIVAPYLGSTGMATTVVLAITLFFKLSSSIKNFADSFKSTNKLIEDGIKKVIPETMYVKIEGVAKEEFAKMKAELTKEVDTKWLNQIKQNTELMQAMALAMCSMKAIPDSQKELLAKFLEIKPETTEALIVDLMPTVESETKKVKATIME
jgi:hypothetical protein